MKRLAFSELPNLPDQVKELVSDGVYALYKVRHADIAYLLVTEHREHYFLSDDGSVLPSGGMKVEDVEVVDAVTFSNGGGGSTVRVNLKSAV